MGILDSLKNAIDEEQRKKYRTPPFAGQSADSVWNKLPPLASAPVIGETSRAPIWDNSNPIVDKIRNPPFFGETFVPPLPEIPPKETKNAWSRIDLFNPPAASDDLPPIPARPTLPASDTVEPSKPPIGSGEGVGIDAEDPSAVWNKIDLSTPMPVIGAPPPAPLTPLQKTERDINGIYNKDYSKAEYDGQGNLIKERGKDRDQDWSVWEKIGSVLDSLSQGQGVAGAIKAGTDRNYFEKQRDRRNLASLQNEYGVQSKTDEDRLGRDYKKAQTANIYADNETQKENLELRKTTAESRRQTAERNSLLRQLGLAKRYKRGENPAFDEKLEAAGIEQPDFEPDKKIKPRYWDNKTGKLMTFDDNNATVPVRDPNGNEIVNDSRREVDSGGYTVMPDAALNAESRVEASRVGAANKDSDDLREWEDEKKAVEEFNNGIDSTIAGKRKVAANLELSNADLRRERESLTSSRSGSILNKERIRQIDSQIQENTKQWRDINGEITELGGKKKSAPTKPTPRQSVTGGGISSSGTKPTKAEAEQYFKNKYNPNPAQLSEMLRQAGY